MENHLNTAKKLVGDNIKFEEQPNLSSNIDIELIMLYFTINKDLLIKSKHPLSSIIVDKLLTHEFTIDDNHIVGDNFIFTIDTFIGIINYLEEIRPSKQVPPVNGNEVKQYKIRHNKETITINGLTINEQRTYLERTLNTSGITKDYISATRDSFNNEASNTIIGLLSSNPTDENYKDLIMSLVNLYPLFYIKDKQHINYEDIKLPKYEIGLRKSTYNDDYINGLESNIKKCYYEASSLIKRTGNYGYSYEDGEEYLEFNPSGSPESFSEIIVHNRVKKLNAEMQHQSAELFFYKYRDDVYSQNYIDQLLKCIEYNGIEITYMGGEPIVTFFYLENNEVKFYSKLHLKTLQKLLPSTTILGIVEEQQLLKK